MMQSNNFMYFKKDDIADGMMNKWFAGLMVCGLAMGMAACSDEDNKNCMAEDPALNTEADAFETAAIHHN